MESAKLTKAELDILLELVEEDIHIRKENNDPHTKIDAILEKLLAQKHGYEG